MYILKGTLQLYPSDSRFDTMLMTNGGGILVEK